MARRRRPLIWLGGGVAVVLLFALIAPLAVVVAAAFFPSGALGISSEEWVAGAGNPVAGVSANTGGSATGVVEKLDGSEFPWVAARSCSAFFNAS